MNGRSLPREEVPEECFALECFPCEGLISPFPVKQKGHYKKRLGNSKQIWPYCIKFNGQKLCAFTDKPVEGVNEKRCEDVWAKMMQDAINKSKVLTLPRKKVTKEVDELVKGIRKALLTELPPTMEDNSQRWPNMRQEFERQHLELIRKDDAASMIRMRIPPGPPAYVNSTPHLACVTHANIFSRVAHAELTPRSLHCVASFLRRAILTGAFHVARFVLMA